MAYITYDQYVAIYGEPPIKEEDFPVYAGLASDLIDSATRYRIVQGGGLSALPPSGNSKYKRLQRHRLCISRRSDLTPY